MVSFDRINQVRFVFMCILRITYEWKLSLEKVKWLALFISLTNRKRRRVKKKKKSCINN